MSPRTRRERYGSAERENLFGLPVQRRLFIPAALLIVSLAAFGTLAPGRLEAGATAVQAAIADHLGWFYLLAMNVFLVLALVLAFGRFGRIRIGGEEAEREFSSWGWYAMLFAAGTGVGLLFYGVAEPISYFAAPPVGEAGSPEAARDALVQSFFHWGLHGWSMYGLVGLALAFTRFNRGLPLTIRSAFEPLIGARVFGPVGQAIDVLAVTGTLFGVAVSLGLGAKQVNTGLAETFGIRVGVEVQLALIAGITVAANISVVTGLSAGIQQLSKLALSIGAALTVYVVAVGPTTFLFHALVESAGAYLQDLFRRGTWVEAFAGPGSGSWQNQWTLFYFAWWISWSPFVGMFIGRISRGRTLREYLLGVLLMPTGVSMVWLTVMGGSALHRELFGAGGLVPVVERNVAEGTFALLQGFPVPEALVLASRRPWSSPSRSSSSPPRTRAPW